MKFIVELLAYGKEGEVREVDAEAIDSPREHHIIILGAVWYYGQNEHQKQDHPSVSVGDVIHVGKSRYLVLPSGFKRLSQTDYDAYKAIPQNQRAIGLYLDNAISKL